ncbi:MAG: FtsH protease activity modulator HflK [Gammaproteobacteria bacterium]|jgi:membrane protease subunit HflK|nr:FtsH protease activity modulator HflK [Gammaproteobacteria bacterium]
MPWNEPGKDKDPWGQRNNDGPPDLDELFRNLKNKFGGLLGGGGRGKIPKVPGGSGNVSGFIGFVLVAALVVWALTGIYIVDEGWRGVETRFGERTVVTQAGPHWHLPYPIEDVELINVADIRTARKNSKMLTSDENIVVMSIEIQYNVKDAQDFAFEVFDPDLTLQQTAETAIREVVGNNDMDLIITEGRAVVGSATKEIMQDILDNYKTGINVVQVNMDEAQPPEEVQDAFEDAIKAREDEQRIINEANAYRNGVVPQARGEGQGLLEQAEAYKTRVVKSAQGETSRFNQLLAEYQRAPEVTRERLYIDTIESVMARSPKVMVDVEGGNNLMFLPLDQLMGRAATNTGQLKGLSGNTTDSQSLFDEFQRNASRNRDRETRQ